MKGAKVYMKDGRLHGYETTVCREIIFSAKNTILSEANYYVLHLNLKVSHCCQMQVYESRTTLSWQTLCAVPPSWGEMHKPDLCYQCLTLIFPQNS